MLRVFLHLKHLLQVRSAELVIVCQNFAVSVPVIFGRVERIDERLEVLVVRISLI